MGEQTHHSGRIQHSQCHWMNFNKIADVNFDELEHAWSKKEEEKKTLVNNLLSDFSMDF